MKKEKGPAPLPPSLTNSTITTSQKELIDDKAILSSKATDDKIVDLLERNEIAVSTPKSAIDESALVNKSEKKVCIVYSIQKTIVCKIFQIFTMIFL